MTTSPQRHRVERDAFEDSSAKEQCEQLRCESEELFFVRQLKPAHTKAVAALKMAIEAYGTKSLHLVRFYLILVDILLCEKQLKPVEEMLSFVHWLLIKNGDTKALATELPETTKMLLVIRINKLYSLLHLECGAFSKGLECAARGAYHCSLLFGPDHVCTSELYFCLSLIFYRGALQEPRQSLAETQQQQRDLQQRNQQKDSTLAMLDKVVDIWYRFLTDPPEDPAAWMSEHRRLVQDASAMLLEVVSMREYLLGAKHVATGEAQFTLGLLYLFLDDHIHAKEFVKQALDIYVTELGSEHPSTVDVIGVFQQLNDAGI